jgi:hypothetical protein
LSFLFSSLLLVLTTFFLYSYLLDWLLSGIAICWFLLFGTFIAIFYCLLNFDKNIYRWCWFSLNFDKNRYYVDGLWLTDVMLDWFRVPHGFVRCYPESAILCLTVVAFVTVARILVLLSVKLL